MAGGWLKCVRLCGLGWLLAGMVLAQENLAPNPGFEAGADGRPADWAAEDPGPNGRAEWSAEAHGGRRSLAGIVGDPPAMVWWNSAPIPLVPGRTYTLSVWYRCTRADGGPPTLQVQGADGRNLVDWNLPVRTEWTRFTQHVALPPQDRAIRIALINYYRAGQGVYWDDVSLQGTYAAEAAGGEAAVALRDAAQTRVAPRPYELGNRKPDYPPALMLASLPGWRVRTSPGVEATAAVSAQQRIWGERCLRVTACWTAPPGDAFLSTSGELAGTQGGGTLELIPPAPVPIGQPGDAVQLWVNGDHYYSPHQPRVTVCLRDGDGTAHEVCLGPVNWMYWFLMYAPLPASLKPPVRLERLVISHLSNPQPLDLYLDALAFIRAPRGPLPARKWTDRLPFPTRPETLLPSVRQPVRNTVRQEGEAYVFACETPDGPVAYQYRPRTGTLSDLTAHVPGEGAWQPLDGGGVELAGGGRVDGQKVTARLLSAQITGDAVTARWRISGGARPFTLTYRLRARGKSLVIDAQADAPEVASFSAGRIVGARHPRVFWPPFANVCRWPQPHVLISDGHFASVLFDWYNTASSAFYGAGEVTHDGARIFDRADYLPDLAGRRHALSERVFLTISNHFDEVLWNIPNPPSPLRDVLRTNLFVTRMHYGGGAKDYDTEFAFWKRLKAHGVDHLTIRLHADFWRDRETFTLKDQAAPAKGGDPVALRYLRNLRRLGYRVGLYSDYMLISPLSESWTPDCAALGPDGDRAEQAFATYFLKPVLAPQLQAHWAARLHAKFGTSASYCDQITQANPGWIEFDPRVPGATQQRTVLQNWGRLLLNERVAHNGPCYGEGGYHAVWAGLCDGNYAQTFQPDAPLMPEFVLRKVHPLQADAGYDLGWLDEPLDKVLAMQIGYGSAGMFWGSAFSRDVPLISLHGVLRSYFMMQQLQARYVMEPVAEIRYHDGAQWVDSDEALRHGAAGRGQVLTTYRNGLTVAVNAHREQNLAVRLHGREHVLPPYGWAAGDAGGFVEYSALRGGTRRDFVRSGPYVYCDGHGTLGNEGGVETAGQVIVLRSPGQLRVVAVPPTGRLRLHLPTLGLAPARAVAWRYTAESDRTVALATRPWPEDGWLALPWPAGACALVVTRR